MTVIFEKGYPTYQIPFGLGRVQVGFYDTSYGPGIAIGKVDPPVEFGSPVPDGDVLADFIVSFSSKEATSLFRKYLDYIDKAFDVEEQSGNKKEEDNV